MRSSPGWLKRALVLFFFGAKAVVFGIVAEDRKPLFGKRIITGGEDGSMLMCELPRLSVAMGSLSVLSLLLTVVAGHLAILYPYKTTKPTVPRRALFQKISLTVFFVIAELVSAAALVTLFWATIAAHGDLRYMPVVADDGTVSCPSASKTDGMFGGGALLALDATLMWFVCLLMSLEARANYLDLHGGGDDDGQDDIMKKLDLQIQGDDDVTNNGNGNDNNKELGLHENNGEGDGDQGRDRHSAEQSMILSPSQSASR